MTRWLLGVAVGFSVAVAAPPDAPVADAAERGELENVRSLLRQGADVNAAQGDGMTALHWAAVRDDAEMIGVLAYAGANLESTTRLGAYTPLHLASKDGRGAAIIALLDLGVEPNTPTRKGVVSLHLAAASGNADAVRVLLDAGANIDAVEPQSGRTPLMFAAGLNRLDVVDVLLEHDAAIDAVTTVVDYAERDRMDRDERRRRSRIREAAKEPQPAAEDTALADTTAVTTPDSTRVSPDSVKADTTVASLPDSVAEAEGQPVDPRQTESDGQAVPADTTVADSAKDEPQPLGFAGLVGRQGGMASLHLAAREGYISVAQRLLDAGGDVNQRTAGDSSSALLVAAINGNYDFAMFLLERGADPNLVSEDGASPLYATINNRWAPEADYPQPTAFKQQKTDYLELMKALLDAGADPNLRLKTHLWYTAFNFDALGVNFSGSTPLWRAAYGTDVPAMRLLVSYGADPNIPSVKPPERRRRTQDADSTEKDHSGLPAVPVGGPGVYPIHAASGRGYGITLAGNQHRHAPDGWLPAVRYLVEELGADVNARDHEGYAALHFAAARGDNELIEYLVGKGADVTVVTRRGKTTVDMANGPIQRVQPYLATIDLLVGMGAVNNNNCMSCE